MSSYLLTVSGTERRALIDGFRAELVLNGLDHIICTIVSEDGSPEVRFELDDEVVLSTAASPSDPVVGGFITHIDEDGEGGPNTGRFLSRLTITGYAEILQRRHITITSDLSSPGSPGPALDDFLQHLVTTYWAAEGITLHPSQSTAAVLKEVSFEDALGTEILNRLATDNGLFWRVDELKRLRMWAKGDVAAPFDIDEDDLPAKYFGDIRTTKSRYSGYANRVIVKGTPQTILDFGESFTSTGVETSFTTTEQMIGTRQSAIGVSGTVTGLGVAPGETFWDGQGPEGSGAHWEYSIHPTTKLGTFTWYNGVLPSGAIVRLVYDAQVFPRGEANDAPDQALYPVRDEIINAPVTNDADAQDLAEQILPYLVAAKDIKAKYSTRELDVLAPGQTQTIDAATRNLSGSFLITQVTLRSEIGGDDLVRDVDTTQGEIPRGDWRNLISQFAAGVSPSNVSNGNGTGNGGNTGGTVITNPDGDAGSGSNLSVPPDDTDVIINKAGALGTVRSAVGGHIRGRYRNAANDAMGTPAAPAVADTGSGSYAATLRYYKIQFAELSGTSIEAISNFGASQSFTPSGSGTHARVTKPTNPGATETHWRVLGSADDVTFVAISAWIVIATTTYDDNVAPGSYAHVGDDQLSYDGTYTTMAQMLLTAVPNDLDSLQKWQSYDGGGVMSFKPWASVYPGEIWIGGDYVNGQLIARSPFVAQMFLDASGDAYLGLRLYWAQTPGAPLDDSTFNEINLRAYTATGNAGGEGGIASSPTKDAMWHAAILALRDQLGAGDYEVPVVIVGTHTANTRELRFQMGDTTRTIRFDGVGSAVTFT